MAGEGCIFTTDLGIGPGSPMLQALSGFLQLLSGSFTELLIAYSALYVIRLSVLSVYSITGSTEEEKTRIW